MMRGCYRIYGCFCCFAVKKRQIKYSTSRQNKCACSSVPGQRFHRHITGTTLFPAQSHSRSTATARHQVSRRFQNPVLESFGDNLKIPSGSIKRRVISRVECFLTSDPASGGSLKPRRWQNSTATTPGSACVHPEYRGPIRRRADCKAEQYGITGSAINPSDGPDTILVGDTSNISPWWVVDNGSPLLLCIPALQYGSCKLYAGASISIYVYVITGLTAVQYFSSRVVVLYTNPCLLLPNS